MTLVFQTGTATSCRTYVVDACDPIVNTSIATIPIDPDATWQIRQRDVLDFQVDWTQVLATMGQSVTIASATFTVPSTSPKTPQSVTGGFDPAGHTVFVLAPATAASVGDIYQVDVEITTTPSTLPAAPNVTVPARTLVRRVQIQVVPG